MPPLRNAVSPQARGRRGDARPACHRTALPGPALAVLCSMVLLAGLLGGASPAGARVSRAAPVIKVRDLPPRPMWTRYWQVRVRSGPQGTILTELDANQEVRVTGSGAAGDGTPWLRVQLWGALEGWVQADLLAPAPVAIPAPGGVPVAPSPVGPHAPMPLAARGIAVAGAALREGPAQSSRALGTLARGTPLVVTRWATDSAGQAWYAISAPAAGWVSAEGVDLLPRAQGVGLAALRGLGMWCTPPVLRVAPPGALVAAARNAHVTHLYVEVGGSRAGFYGADLLRKLLPAAHAAHIAVIAWVYPFLDDLPGDMALSLAAARYVAPSGDRPDGLMVDLEQNMVEPYVRAYSQVLRALLGAQMPMGVATYPPQSYWGRRYPFRTVAYSWDVIVPMDYWHLQRRAYTPEEVYRYVAASIAGVRAASGRAAEPVEVLGQTYDAVGGGVGSPSAAEIAAAARAARDGGAQGISFFEWNHATPEEWDTLAALPAPPGR